jgi:hypothetical protein
VTVNAALGAATVMPETAARVSLLIDFVMKKFSPNRTDDDIVI